MADALGNSELSLALKREKALYAMNAEDRAFNKVLYSLVDAQKALTDSERGLETAYKGLVNMRDSFIALGKGLSDYYAELTGVGNPTASPEEIYNSSKKAFTDASALAAQGNEQALSDLPKLSKDFLAASKDYNATGEAYQADYKAVLGGLEKGMAVTRTQVSIMDAQLAQAVATNANLATLNASVNTVASAIAGLSSALASYSTAKAAVTTATAAVVDKQTVSDKEIKDFVAEYINDPKVIADAAAQYGVSNSRIAAATGYSVDQVNDYLKNVPAYANGGMAKGISMVGEQGAELVNFGSPANVTNHSQTNGLFDNIAASIQASSKIQVVFLKEQVVELKALVTVQSAANIEMINELKGMKAEMAELSRKAKLEASS